MRAHLLFTIISLGIVLFSCSSREKIQAVDAADYHAYISSKNYAQLSREEQLSKCIACHPNEAKNEELGPHSVSYDRLLTHFSLIASQSYDEPFYHRFVQKSNENCLGCHSPVTLAESNYYSSGWLSKQVVPLQLIMSGKVIPRYRNESPSTGVDCISCHVHYDKIEPLTSIERKGAFTKYELIQNNLNCYACHKETFDSYDLSNDKLKNTFSCNSCHIEKQKGKSTHYFYWKEHPKRQIPLNLLNDIQLKLIGNELHVKWFNRIIPHKLNSCPEFLIDLELINEKSELLTTKVIRINNMNRFNSEMCQYMEGENHRVIPGIEIPTKVYETKFILESSICKSLKMIKLSFSHKAQFWFDDSTKHVKRTRLVKLN